MTVCLFFPVDMGQEFGQAVGVASLMCACSLGIYQAYFPLTISLFVILLIQEILKYGSKLGKVFLKGILFLATLILSLLLYFIFLKVFLKYYQVSLNNYQGINEMGKCLI